MTPAQPQRWWQNIGQLGQSVAGIARDRIQHHQANHALSDYSGLDAGIDQAVQGTPQQGAGPEPPTDGQVITSPTKVLLDKGEAVVPLGYRAEAKVRPSMAMQQPGRNYYGA